MRGIIFSLSTQRDKVVDERIAKFLRTYGHDVERHGYVHNARLSVPYMKPDFVVVPMIGGLFKLDFVKKCKSWGIEVIVRRGEAGVSREQFQKLRKERRKIIIGNWDYDSYVDLELVWGGEFLNLLAEHGTIARHKLRACGGFAFDAYFDPDVKRKAHGKRAVLFATGFSCGEADKPSPECGLPKDHPFQIELHRKNRLGRDVWINAIKEVHRKFGDSWDYALKVRPGELTQEYRDKLGDIVTILDQGCSATDALQQVDLLIHTGSTMAIEAHLLGIPSFNFFNMNPDTKLAGVGPRLESSDELIISMGEVDLSQSNILKMGPYDEVVKRLYDQIDGKACERAAEEINSYFLHRGISGITTPHIPDTWPLVPDYLKPPSTLEEQKKSDVRWLCPACPGRFFAPKGITATECPFCGMTIEFEIVRLVYGKQGSIGTNRRNKGKGGKDDRHGADNRGVRSGSNERSAARHNKAGSRSH